MQDWIFKRPPTPLIELPGKNERFEVRVTLRMDQSLYNDFQRMDLIAAKLAEATRELEKRMQEAFNSELFAAIDHPFLIDDRSGTPHLSETTPDGMIITSGVNFKRRVG